MTEIPYVDAPQEIRCQCSRSPLLGRGGIDKNGPFVWVRHTKSKKIIADVKFRGGVAQIVCRECLRTWTITVGKILEISHS